MRPPTDKVAVTPYLENSLDMQKINLQIKGKKSQWLDKCKLIILRSPEQGEQAPSFSALYPGKVLFLGTGPSPTLKRPPWSRPYCRMQHTPHWHGSISTGTLDPFQLPVLNFNIYVMKLPTATLKHRLQKAWLPSKLPLVSTGVLVLALG